MIAGFHPAAESDPFASKSSTDLTTASIPVAGLAGAHVIVTLGCKIPAPEVPLILVSVTLSGAVFDAPAQLGTDPFMGTGTKVFHDMDLKYRFDQLESGIQRVGTDEHKFAARFGSSDIAKSNRLLLGFPVNGRTVALQIALHEASIARAIAPCVNQEAENARKGAEQQKAFEAEDAKRKADAAAQAKANAEQAALAKERQQISSDFARNNWISGPAPNYPPVARAAHIRGTVVLEIVVSIEGTVKDMHVVSGPAMLQASAMEAVKQWRYKPYMLDGQPHEIQTTVNVNFN